MGSRVVTIESRGNLQRDRVSLHALPSFSAELQVLMSCGGPAIRAANRERLERLTRTSIDWDLTYRLSLWHGMHSLLYWNLVQRDGQGEPLKIRPETMDALRESYLRTVGSSLRMTGDLLAIIESMDRVGVLVIPYKGPVLSSRLYGNPALRRSVDLDIVVRRIDLEKARRCLIELGYSPSVMLHGTNHDFQVESRYSEKFEKSGGVVELHWAFTNKDVAFPLTLEELKDRLDTYVISGRPIRVFHPDDTLLILCVHGAKHGWVKLEWICGIAELVGADSVDWEWVFARARGTRSLRKLLLGLCLAHDLYGIGLPESVKRHIRDDRQTLVLAAAVSSALIDGGKDIADLHTFGTLDHDLFNFRLADGLSESLRYLIYRVTTPSRPENWSTISVGGRSVSLHSFTRPFGIAGKLLPAIWRRYAPSRHSSRGRS
jgi:hypothetical protein